jgi:integrase
MADRLKRYFGNVRKLKSGRFQARYTGPDRKVYKAPNTFSTETLAERWLGRRLAEIEEGRWTPPVPVGTAPAVQTLREYGDTWLAGRHLEESTREQYRMLLDKHIYPGIGDLPITDATLSPVTVRFWYANVARGDGKDVKDRPAVRAHAYSLLKTILGTAIDDKLLTTNPCRVRGASTSKRARKIRPVEMDELEVILGKLPEKYRLMVLLACWCSLRFGELAELRRGDVDLRNELLRVRRSVVRTKGQRHVKDPKSQAGKRDVHVPPHIMPVVKTHLRDHVNLGRDALLFPSAGDPTKHLAASTLKAVFHPARDAAGRPDLRFHDLRHSGATLAARAGATIADLMARLGHSTPRAAMIYQHTAASRDKGLAAALSELATVTHIDTARKEETA